MRVKAVKFQYQRRPPFTVFLRIAKHELENIDEFLNMARKAQRSQQQSLERLAAKFDGNTPDDWLVDDFAQLDDFASLSAEFAIIGLWRCIELYRARAKRAIRVASRRQDSANPTKNRKLQKEFANWESMENRIHCARSVDELRCLNNAIKHQQRVSDELAGFRCCRSKKGRELQNLEPHYKRLWPLAERYLNELTDRLGRRWKNSHA